MKLFDKLKHQQTEKADTPPTLPKAEAAQPAQPAQPAQSKPRLQLKVAPRKTEGPTKANKLGLLHGTGITKRKAEQAERDAHKQQEAIAAKQAELHTESAESATPATPAASAEPAQPPIIDLHANKSPEQLLGVGITLDEDQSAAVTGLHNQKYGCLIGAAGTGKTTTVKAIVASLESSLPTIDLNNARAIDKEKTSKPDFNVAICFCSFMGKAVQQMKRALPKHYHPMTNTIHATLGYMPTVEEFYDENAKEWKEKRVFRPTFTAANKLPYKICIVDESGTVPIYLWNELLAALPDDCRVFLMGDINQLPPVQGRSVLPFAMLQWPTYTLTKIHRQAADNPIIANAHRILSGKKPLSARPSFVVKTIDDGSSGAFRDCMAVIQHLHKQSLFDPITDAFIVPQNISTIGQIAFNKQLRRYFNPTQRVDNIPINPPTIIQAGRNHPTFAVNDKVMILSNERQLGLTNGMTGVVRELTINNQYRGESIAASAADFANVEIDLSSLHDDMAKMEEEKEKQETEEKESERQASHIMMVEFPQVNQLVQFTTAGQYAKVAHAYAMTCHKSQGSEYPTVIILCHSANIRMLNREWLYTAVTRAQERVIILCNNRGLTHAVNQQTIKGNTIEEKAERFIALMDREDTQLPNLPEPQAIKH